MDALAPPEPSLRVPGNALVAGLVFPGAGFVYAGKTALGVGTAVVVLGMLFGFGWLATAVLLHLYAAFAARTLVQDLAAGAPVRFTPDPSTEAENAIEPPPVPEPEDVAPEPEAPPPHALDGRGLLLELRSDWESFCRGSLDEGEFARRKAEAIDHVGVATPEEADGLLETVPGLVAAGVLTPEEGARLENRVRSS